MFMKTCSKCKNKKPLKDFYKDRDKKDGFASKCKSCYIKKYRTRRGYIKNSYNNLIGRIKYSKFYNGIKCDFTEREFIDFMNRSKSFDHIWKRWVATGYNNKYAPTIDRVDNKKGYSLGNIQIITKCENSKKVFKDNPAQNCKPVVCIDLKTTFSSAREASRILGVNYRCVSLACNQKIKTAGGKKWTFL